jgi:serine/threonine-protein kinase RsbW
LIQLRVPASLLYRNLVLRVVAEACNFVPPGDPPADGDDDFRSEAVTAVGEAFNNIAIHGGAGVADELVEVQIEPLAGRLVVRLVDHGRSFDPDAVPSPELDRLPEGGLGLFIIRSFMDDVSYRPGPPNVLALTKSRGGRPRPGGHDETLAAPPSRRGGSGRPGHGLARGGAAVRASSVRRTWRRTRGDAPLGHGDGARAVQALSPGGARRS